MFVLALTMRLAYVWLFAESTPFWDQWDAEADSLLRAWVEGTWRFADLFALHNEHRIAFSRLLSIALFEANDRQWDNLVTASANAVLFAAMMAALFALLRRERTSRWSSGAVLVAIVALAALPFEWENFLVGFQSQFFFMAIAAIALIALMAFRPLSRTSLLLGLVLGVASLFTMASGLLASAAAIAVLWMRNWRDTLRPAVILAYGVVFLAILAVGIVLVPDLPLHRPLRAAGVVEHLDALSVALMWPVQETTAWPLLLRLSLASIVWAPSLLWMWRFVRRRSASAVDLFAAGMAVWIGLQALAMAHSRGHEMAEVSSRYMGLLSLGIPVNVYFASRLVAQVRSSRAASRWAHAAAAVFFVFLAGALIDRTPGDVRLLSARRGQTQVQTENTRAYVATGDFRHLQQPFLHIPYPSADRLRSLLDEPSIRAMLPPSIRAPLPLAPSAQDFSPDGVPPSPPPPQPRQALGSFGRPGGALMYASPVLHTSFPYLLFLTLGEGTLALVGDGAPAEARTSAPLHGTGWSGHLVAAPAPAFRVEAADAGAEHRLAFTDPVEIGRLSRWALRSQAEMRRLADRLDLLAKTKDRAVQSP
ncbi:hypothetical protein [Dokdonella sp.]|uniref:hypothetical protein n=1 Tax=Dokdonella sp. TaxID=2291710 RepID=UPI001B2A3185|nr:hypothetical protein [Dokdonella sp.]MBO9663789.1 hypothetical protein [Dokdonella sp.]